VLIGAGAPVPVPGRRDRTYPFRAHSEYLYLTDRERLWPVRSVEAGIRDDAARRDKCRADDGHPRLSLRLFARRAHARRKMRRQANAVDWRPTRNERSAVAQGGTLPRIAAPTRQPIQVGLVCSRAPGRLPPAAAGSKPDNGCEERNRKEPAPSRHGPSGQRVLLSRRQPESASDTALLSASPRSLALASGPLAIQTEKR
jgi:hypothetical protein